MPKAKGRTPRRKTGKAPKAAKEPRPTKAQREKKPKGTARGQGKYIAPPKFKSKRSKAVVALQYGSGKRGQLTDKQVQQRAEFARHAGAVHRIKALRREGVPMKQIQDMLFRERKAKARKQKNKKKQIE